MGWIKGALGLAWAGTKGVVKTTAWAANETRHVVVDNRDLIAAAGKTAVSVTGKAVQITGKAAKGAADLGAKAAYTYAAGSSGGLGKSVGVAAGLAADSVGLVGRGVDVVGGIVDRSGGVVGDAIGGAAAGTVSLTSEALDSIAIQGTDLGRMRAEVRRLGLREQEYSTRLEAQIREASAARRKSELLDLYVIGGVSLAEMARAPSRVPEEVQTAFELAYPGLAAQETFSEAVTRLSPEQLPGLVSGVKGKLFELELVNYLNDGNLPEGMTASLAESATQGGWDIQVLDQSGEVAELLQAKATESAAYVKQALDRYPGIDVVTTEEVYAQLAALGLAERVQDSGISEATLEQMVSSAANVASTGVDFSDLLPSALGLAVVGLSVFMDKSLTAGERAAVFGERSGRVSVSSLAGKGVMLATQTWWLGLLGGVGTHWLSSKGRVKREQYEALSSVLNTLRQRDAGHPALRLDHAGAS